MKNSTPLPRKEFWDTQKKLLKIGTTGKIFYTEDGKKEYRPLFARYGYAIENVTTLEHFSRVIKDISAMQMEENNAELLRLLNDPLTPIEEREVVSSILGIPVPALPPVTVEKGTVLDMAAFRARLATE
jgi:hypothetical protein